MDSLRFQLILQTRPETSVCLEGNKSIENLMDTLENGCTNVKNVQLVLNGLRHAKPPV